MRANNRVWAFRLFIYTIVMNIVAAYQITMTNGLQTSEALSLRMLILSVITGIFWVSGIVFTVLSFVKKEESNYQKKIALWGFLIFTAITLGLYVLSYFLNLEV